MQDAYRWVLLLAKVFQSLPRTGVAKLPGLVSSHSKSYKALHHIL